MPTVPRILLIDDNEAIHADFRKILCPEAVSSVVDEMEASLFETESKPRAEIAFEVDSACQGEEGLGKVQRAMDEGRPYALMICAGSDGEGAARQITRIATGWRLRTVAEPLIICTRAQTPEAILAPKVIAEADLAKCHDLGAAMAQGLAMGIF